MRVCRYLCGIVLLCVTVSSGSASAAALTVRDAVRLALTEASEARTLQLDQVVQDAQFAAAQSEFSPRLNLSGQSARQWQSGISGPSDSAGIVAGSTLKLPSGTQIEAGINWAANRSPQTGTLQPATRFVQIVQPLLRGFGAAARLSLDLARVNALVFDVQRKQTQDALYLAVVLGYYEAVQARQQVQVAEQALDRVAQNRRVNQSLIETGGLARMELLQSDADLAQAELNLAQARNTADSSASALLQLLGRDMARSDARALELADPVPQPDTTIPAEAQALAEARQQRDDLQVSALLVKAARLGVSRAADDAALQLDVVAGVQTATGGISSGAGGPAYSLGMKFSVPLDRSTLQLQKTQAEVTLQKAEIAQEDVETLVRTEVRNALRDLDFALRQLTLSRDTADLQRRKLEAEQEKFRAGRTSSFQLSAAQDALRAAESAEVQAQLASLRARLLLHKATGQLSTLREHT